MLPIVPFRGDPFSDDEWLCLISQFVFSSLDSKSNLRIISILFVRFALFVASGVFPVRYARAATVSLFLVRVVVG